MGPTYGWRSPFIVIAIPAIICGILVFFTANEPKRGSHMSTIVDNYTKDEDLKLISSNIKKNDDTNDISNTQDDSSSETMKINKMLDLLKTPTVLLCYIQGIPGCVPWSIITVFMSDYLSTDRGLSIKQATYIFSAFGIGGAMGQILGRQMDSG